MARQIDHQFLQELRFTNELLLAIARTMVCQASFMAASSEHLTSAQSKGMVAKSVDLLEPVFAYLHKVSQEAPDAGSN